MEGGREESEYESDPEDALRPLAMRRQAASDDEDGEGSDGGAQPARRGRASEGESEEEEDDEDLEEEDADEEDADEEEELEEEAGMISEEGGIGGAPDGAGTGTGTAPDTGRIVGEAVGNLVEGEEEEEEKKENEPSAVPTAGAFYMHDDRFGESGRGRGRRRRLPGARNFWESKDDRAWVHDRFEEMNLQDSRDDEQRRTAKGRFRGRGNNRSRGTDRGYIRGNRSRAYDDNIDHNNRSRGYDESNNQNRALRSVRGRGPRRYESLTKYTSEAPAGRNKQYAESRESTSGTSARTQASVSSNMQPDPVIRRKHVVASSLSSASPPFYPSRSSDKDASGIQRREPRTVTESRTGINSKTNSSSMQMGNNFSSSQSDSLLRGKTIVGSVGHNSRHTDNSIRPVSGKALAGSQLQAAGSSLSSASPTQSHSRFQGRGVNTTGPVNHQSATVPSQITRASTQTQVSLVQQKPIQTPVQAVMQQMAQRSSSGFQTSSPSQAINQYDVGETRSPPSSSKSNAPLVGKGIFINQGGSGSGSFMYTGASQVLVGNGEMGLSHSDQGFPPTPALLQVMQFGGQHHGGAGVPAVGMALPGYVAQQQLGFGNSEMTWVPVLAGAAGGLGAPYGSPYIALDGNFYAHTSGQGQISSSTISRESGPKPGNRSKSPQDPETGTDESGQRQNKPRRYSEMNFGQ